MKTKFWQLTLTDPRFDAAYDVQGGCVVEATGEKRARELAAAARGDEGEAAWLDPARSTCEALELTGESRFIIQDFNAG